MAKEGLPKLTEAVIRNGPGQRNFSLGQELYRNGAISNTAVQGKVLTGHCAGTQSPYYKVRVELDSGGIRLASCNCHDNFD